MGEAIVAFVVPSDPAAPPETADLDASCLAALARYKRPKEYRFVDALPTNNYGKVVKRELRAAARGTIAWTLVKGLVPTSVLCHRDLTYRRCCDRNGACMKLALYLPNFRDKVSVKELEDLTALAEEPDFDSVWTLDRIVVPEASDRGGLQYAFGMIPGFPNNSRSPPTASFSRAGR